MKHKSYKSLFYFYNFIGVLNLRFNGQKFKISKFLKYKSALMLIAVSADTIFNINHDLILNSRVSEFSEKFLGLYNISSKILILLMMWIFLKNQKDIAKIFDIFIHFHKVSKELKINVNLRKMRKKFRKFLYVMLFFILCSVAYFKVKINPTWQDLAEFIVRFFFIMNMFGDSSFSYFLLAHFELLLKHFNQVLEERINMVHNSCEDVLKILILVNRFFKTFNDSWRVLLPMLVVNHLVVTVKAVRKIVEKKKIKNLILN